MIIAIVWLIMGSRVAVIDRIEGDFAVLEWDDNTLVDVAVQEIPLGCHEGSRIRTSPRTQTKFKTRRRKGWRNVVFVPADRHECVVMAQKGERR